MGLDGNMLILRGSSNSSLVRLYPRQGRGFCDDLTLVGMNVFRQ
jgi:hypothetical protein